MAIAFVAERYKNAAAVQPGNGVTNTLGVSGISVGNHLIILVSLRGGAAGAVITPVSASDNAGNTYTLDVSLPSTSSTMGVALLSAHMGAAPTQVTLTFNNAGASAVTCAFKVEEFSGLASTGYFDVGASSTPAATFTPTWPTITPAAAGELIFAGLAGGGNAPERRPRDHRPVPAVVSVGGAERDRHVRDDDLPGAGYWGVQAAVGERLLEVGGRFRGDGGLYKQGGGQVPVRGCGDRGRGQQGGR